MRETETRDSILLVEKDLHIRARLVQAEPPVTQDDAQLTA